MIWGALRIDGSPPQVLLEHGVLCKQGWTFKLRLFASLYFGSGWTEFCWAFSCYLVLLFLYWASVPGWTINNALPAQSPDRQTVKKLSFS